MKRCLMLMFIMIMTIGLLHAQTITVTNPGAGDTWYIGSSGNVITWTKTGSMDANVKITLYNPAGTTLIKVIVNPTDNDGTHSWTIPGDVPPGNYVVRVKTVDNEVWDDGETFAIANPPSISISVNDPAAGVCWEKGSSKTIRWTKAGSMGAEVKILLLNASSMTEVKEIVNPTANDGSYPLTVPADVPDGNYVIRVKVIGDPVKDESGVFAIKEDCPHLEPGRFENIKMAQPWYKIKWPFPWPGPDPDPDPWWVGELPMEELLNKFKGRQFRGVKVGLILFLGGKNFGSLGKFQNGEFTPEEGNNLKGNSLVFRLSSRNIGMLRKGGQGKLIVKDLETGKILAEQALQY